MEGLYFDLNKSSFEDKGMEQSFRKQQSGLAMTLGQAFPRGCGIWRNPSEGIFIDILFLLLCTFALRELSLTLFYVLLMGCGT